MSEKASSFTVQKNTKQDELDGSERENTLRQQEEHADIENAPLREDLDDSAGHPAGSGEERVESEVDNTGVGDKTGDNTTPDLNITVPKPETTAEVEN